MFPKWENTGIPTGMGTRFWGRVLLADHTLTQPNQTQPTLTALYPNPTNPNRRIP